MKSNLKMQILILAVITLFGSISNASLTVFGASKNSMQKIQQTAARLNNQYANLNLEILEIDPSQVDEAASQLKSLESYLRHESPLISGEVYLLACKQVVCAGGGIE
jgi:hypothetical protein